MEARRGEVAHQNLGEGLWVSLYCSSSFPMVLGIFLNRKSEQTKRKKLTASERVRGEG